MSLNFFDHPIVAFLVGTMAQVSKKIGELDKSLQEYTQLVFDSRLSEHEDTTTVMPFTPDNGSTHTSAKHKRRGSLAIVVFG